MLTKIEIPELAVVALVGVSGSGKSTFANKHFKPTEVLSSDCFRAMICDDENSLTVSQQAFDSLYYIANKRLDLGKLTVIDATNVQKEARAGVLKLAKEQNCHAVAIVLNIPENVCKERNDNRPDRTFGGNVITRQSQQLRRSLKHLKKEGFRYVYVLNSQEEADNAEIVRTPLWNNKKDEHTPLDIIGDIHGCYDELSELLKKLGYPRNDRKVVFLGDLCDRGEKNTEVLQCVMSMVKSGQAYCVAGNHDVKLVKYLRDGKGQLTHGLAITVEQLQSQSPEFVKEVITFLDGLISHYVFDDGKLVVAHAGLIEKYHGRGSGRVRHFCLYGDTTGETDEYGLPVRLPWANEYRGAATVVFGHTPIPDVEIVNNTYCVDTGCVFGGSLTALRYPEKEIAQVRAAREYYEPVKPLFAEIFKQDDDVLNINDVTGQRHLSTRLRKSIKINAENSAAALEVMSRFAVDPHWLIYLPPTMSPCETSALDSHLEHPLEAFEYYKSRGVGKVVCEQKHMGSRAVIVLCKDEETAVRIFKTSDGGGVIYTRTGRRFFDSIENEKNILERLRTVLNNSGFWEDFKTDWVCLDTELMPWSAKAQKLLAEQYAPVGRAGRSGLESALSAVEKAKSALSGENPLLTELAERCKSRKDALSLYTDSYRRYCWDVSGIDDYKIAPFHILATEGKCHNGENHIWHMETVKEYICGIDGLFMATNYIVADLLDEDSVNSGVKWWEDLTVSGGEGMVVKPFDFISFNNRELLQPAVKCRGREYLRIIYGAEYLINGNLERLKKRSLSKKRSLALSEFALGMESLERFAKGEPLYRVHECVFGVLAMESEPVDPRL